VAFFGTGITTFIFYCNENEIVWTRGLIAIRHTCKVTVPASIVHSFCTIPVLDTCDVVRSYSTGTGTVTIAHCPSIVRIKVVDPNPDWIRIQWPCGSRF
jgi:hypothetical protein